MKEEFIQTLIEEYLNGQLSEEDFAELQDLLKKNPTARRLFRRHLNLDAALYEQVEGDSLAADHRMWQFDTGQVPTVPSVPLNIVRWAFPLAAAFLIGSVMWWINPAAEKTADTATEEEAMLQGFAILTRTVDAQWTNQNANYRSGQILPAGRLQLESGLAQVEFFSGATVILQGNTDLEIISNGEARCHNGRIRAHVPPAARGFILRTPKGDIVDLGTDFAVDISGQDARVHVFEGEVEVHQEKQQAQSFKTGQGFDLAKRTPTGQAPVPGSFLSVADLDNQSIASSQSRFAKWKNYSQTLRKDPRLIAYYTFDQPGSWNRTLANVSSHGRERNGAIVGARRVGGRWPEKKSALEFKPTGSRTRVFIPGEYKSLTFACWARIDSLDRKYNALFLADNYQPGEPHWQIQNDGRLMLSILIRETGKFRNYIYFSPVIWDLTRSGQWMHIASVFDEANQTVIHYVNGEEVSREKAIPEREVHTTRIGAGEIGNWGLPMKPDDPWFAVRNLNGAIDEFAIFSDVLTREEIQTMYEIGKPN